MKFVYIICLLSSSIMFSQSKAIVPKQGAIVFVKEENIFDKDLYIKSFKELMPQMKAKMKEDIFIERLTDGKKTDTLLLNLEVEKMAQNFVMMLPYMVEEPSEKIKIHHEFNRDTIIMYYSIDGKVNNKIFINSTSLEAKNVFNEYVDFDKNEIIKISEFKNEIKTINGFKCFKVIYNFKTQGKSVDFSNFSMKNRELWVTEKIKCNYHPVINDIEILEKYYPLEIIEYSNDIKGILTTFKIETIKLN